MFMYLFIVVSLLFTVAKGAPCCDWSIAVNYGNCL